MYGSECLHCPMMETKGNRSRPTCQLLVIATLIGLGYICIRTLRFTNSGLNLAFVCGFFLIPFFAIRPMLRLHRWRRALVAVPLTLFLAISSVALLFTVSCDIPAYAKHTESSRELSTIQQRRYSVHLLWEETAGGAVGRHGVVLEQRMFIVPGLYTVKYLDYFEGACEGNLSVAGTDKVKLHIPKSCSSQQEAEKVYSLKHWFIFE